MDFKGYDGSAVKFEQKSIHRNHLYEGRHKMQKKIITALAGFCLALCGISGTVFGQSDTLDVPVDYAAGNIGSLNKFIADDIADNGVPEGRVYRLKRGEIYLLSGTIKIEDFTLRLYGEEGPPETQPAAVAGFKADGTGIWQFFTTKRDIEFKNIYFKGATAQDALTGECVRFLTPDLRLTVDNCIIDSFHFVAFHFFKVPGGSAFITNSIFRNLNHVTGGLYNGRAVRFFQKGADSVVVVNNTMANSNSFFVDMSRLQIANYANIDHNTIVSTVKYPLHWHYQTDARYTNNLFYNASAYGETVLDAASQDPDGLVYGLVSVDTLGSPDLGAEADRNFLISNNAWSYGEKVKAYWNARDTVNAMPWMNSRTEAMFANDTDWPGLVAENNINSAVNFTLFPDRTDAMLAYMEGVRDNTPVADPNWGYYPSGIIFKIDWPLKDVEDLSYATTDPAYTAGTGGFPIGDLNWFPAKKAEWEGTLSSVGYSGGRAIPTDFELDQNYPNPFNPQTTISYKLNKAAQVKVIIYNMLGQVVHTLVDAKQSAGTHSVIWNSRDSRGQQVTSGVYFYKLETADGISLTQKMVLMK